MSQELFISIVGGVVSIITCIISNRTSHQVDINHIQTNEALKSMIRNDISILYYANKEHKTLKEYERMSLDHLYEGYKDMGGNTFVDDIYKEMRKWEVIR